MKSELSVSGVDLLHDPILNKGSRLLNKNGMSSGFAGCFRPALVPKRNRFPVRSRICAQSRRTWNGTSS